MTARAGLPPLGDNSLAALAFVQAVAEGNHLNWQHMLDTTGRDELLVGLANVAVKLAHGLAVNTGTSLDDVFEVHRTLFLLMGAE